MLKVGGSLHGRRAGVIVVLMVAAMVACDPAPLPTRPASVEVLTGTTASVEVPFPEFDHVADVAVADPSTNGVTTDAAGGFDVGSGNASVAITVTADLDAEPVAVALSGHGCLVPSTDDPTWACPKASTQAFDVQLTVSVVSPSAAVPDGYAPPDPERWEAVGEGEARLAGEVGIAAAPGVSAEEIGGLVADLGGGLTGADAALGLYQARFDDPDVAVAALNASPQIIGAEPVVGQAAMPSGEPVDWADDGTDATWNLRQIGAPEGWGRTTGSQQVGVGVVDWAIYSQHADLRLASYDAPHTEDRVAMLQASPGHGTHVAGTMCLPDGNGGLVGAVQQCQLHALELAGTPTIYQFWHSRLSELRHWLERHPEIRVVNFSGSFLGAHPNNGCATRPSQVQATKFNEAFQLMDDVLWVIAAGNCNEGPGDRRSSADHLPAALHFELSNVVAVSATARAEGDTGSSGPGNTAARVLAPYSATDGTIAAPGGTADDPVWSTLYGSCRWWRSTPCPSTWSRESRAEAGSSHPRPFAGTSMAAPLVAGTAALMLSLDPGVQTHELKDCLVAGATTPIAGAQVRELWIPAALDCASPAAPPGAIVPAGPPGTADAQWSSTGRFLTSYEWEHRTDVFVVDRDSGTTSVLSGPTFSHVHRTWSTDDAVLVVTRCDGDDLGALQAWNQETGQSRIFEPTDEDRFGCSNVFTSPDGRFVSFFGRKHDLPPPPDDDPFSATTYVWDTQTGDLDMMALPGRTLGYANAGTDGWAPVGHKLLASTYDFEAEETTDLVVYDLDTGEYDLLSAPLGRVHAAAFDESWSPDGRYLLLVPDTPIENHLVQAYDAATGTLLPPVELPGGVAGYLTTTWVAGAGEPTVWLKTIADNSLNLFRPGTGELTTLVNSGEAGNRIFDSISPTGSHGAWQVELGATHIHDVATGETQVFEIPVEGSRYLEWPTWSDDGQVLAFRNGHQDPRAFVWTATTGAIQTVQPGRLGGDATPVQLSPDGRYLAVIDRTRCCDFLSGNLRVWDRTTEGSSDHLGWLGYDPSPSSPRWWSPSPVVASLRFSVEEQGTQVAYLWTATP